MKIAEPKVTDGLELLASAVLLLDREEHIIYANPAGENLLESSSKALRKQKLSDLFLNGHQLAAVFKQVLTYQFDDLRQDLVLNRLDRELLWVDMIANTLDNLATPVLIELGENVRQLKLKREERLLDQSQLNKELIHNLTHEIKNPLGGIRGIAQLLELELPERQPEGIA